MKNTIAAILVATLWISVSEFVRNEFLLKSYWVAHYQQLGMVFPANPANGAVWGLWSLCYAIVIFLIAQKYTLVSTALIAWFIGFVLMWLVIGNLQVLPFGILPYAIPLSILEAYVASVIIHRIAVGSRLNG